MGKELPEIADLRKHLAYNVATGEITWTGDRPPWLTRGRAPEAGSRAFASLSDSGYLYGRAGGRKIRAHRVCWALVHGYWPDQIDHINGIRTDNRIANLRDVSNRENSRNRAARKGRVTGIYWTPQKGKWRAAIYPNNRATYLGYFHCFGEAVKARKLASRAYGFHENHGR